VAEPASGELEIRAFEFDDRNTRHFHSGLNETIIWDVWAGPFRLFVNAPNPTRTGSHLMIGPDAEERWWTVVLLLIDDQEWLWRPITGWPSTKKEQDAWHAGG
jgi:hypothetical protein